VGSTGDDSAPPPKDRPWFVGELAGNRVSGRQTWRIGIRALGSGGLRVARVTVTRVSESLQVTGSLARRKSAWASTGIALLRRISVLATGIEPPGSTGHGLSSLFVSLMLGLSLSLSLWFSPSLLISLSLPVGISLSPSASRSLSVSPSPCVCVLRKHREERRRKKE
jgi:hypothetical protein